MREHGEGRKGAVEGRGALSRRERSERRLPYKGKADGRQSTMDVPRYRGDPQILTELWRGVLAPAIIYLRIVSLLVYAY